MRRSIALLATWVFVASAVGCVLRGSGEPPAGVVLTGSWVLDRDSSRDPDSVAAFGGVPGQDGPRQQPTGGTGGDGSPAGPPGGDVKGGGGAPRPVTNGEQARLERRRRSMEALRALLRASERLALAQGDSEVTLTYADGPPITLPTNGRGIKREWSGIGVVEFKAEWKGEELQIERKTETGLKIKESIGRGLGGSRLIVDMTIEGLGSRTLTARRIYDRAAKS